MPTNANLAVSPKTPSDPVAGAFIDALQRSDHRTDPFDFWLLDDVLPNGFCEAIASLPFAPPEDIEFDGRRETNNSTRVFFSPDVQQSYVVCRRMADGFSDPQVIEAIEILTGTDLTDTRLRIEYCQDTSGFWLAPHTDIAVKKFTMLIYLSDHPSHALVGTDLHRGPPDHVYVGSAPFGRNKGLIFIPGDDTWHGAGHNKFRGVRKSIIVNYVTSDWRETRELA